MKTILMSVGCLVGGLLQAQHAPIQFSRPNNMQGLNIFETPKTDTVPYNGIQVKIGGDFAMQFQSMDQSNTAGTLLELGADFNLPSANLNLDVQLLEGVSMQVKTYLSSRHHHETWIKGGHLQIDKLEFIRPGFLEGFMQYLTISVGLDEINYGDAHFRRSDNARAIFNPFVGNYIMDGFTTEAFAEINYQQNTVLLVAGISNGKLNQEVGLTTISDNQPSYYGKVGIDKLLTEELRIRLTGSWYINQGTTTGSWLYGGDRAGARYHQVLHTKPDSTGNFEGADFDGRYNPGFKKLTSWQINPFIKFNGLEFFAIYELANGSLRFPELDPGEEEGKVTQIAAELLYRFGRNAKFYVGGRYNTIRGKEKEGDLASLEISRINVGGGWFLSQNILTKIEYVSQRYEGDAWSGRFEGAQFSGVNLEAVISF